MANRPCLDCGVPTTGTRCDAHRIAADRERLMLKSQARPVSPVERRRRAAAVAAHRAERGDWCPGWADRPAHVVVPPNVLTADHVVAVASGGREDGELTVRCRLCNSAKRDRQ